MELRGLPATVTEVLLVPAGNPLRLLGMRYKTHLAGARLAPLGTMPTHKLQNLHIHSGEVAGSGYYYTCDKALMLDLRQLLSCAAKVEVSGMGLWLAVCSDARGSCSNVAFSAGHRHQSPAGASGIVEAFLASQADSLVLQPAGDCWVLLQPNCTAQALSSYLQKAAAEAYLEAVGAHNKMVTGRFAGHYSAASAPADIQAAKEAAAGDLCELPPLIEAVSKARMEDIVQLTPDQRVQMSASLFVTFSGRVGQLHGAKLVKLTRAAPIHAISEE